MNDRIPRTECDHVLIDVKAKPSGWPTASLDPDSGRGPQATSGTPAPRDPQFQVSTVPGDCRRKDPTDFGASIRCGRVTARRRRYCRTAVRRDVEFVRSR
jgi:hypothetical protein